MNETNSRDGYRKKMAKELATSMNMPMAKSRRLIEKTFDMMVEALCKEGRLELRNFGVFEVVVTEARTGRNPKTGATVLIPRSHKVKFKPGKEMIIKIIEEKRKDEVLIST